jgi:two-component sensor histidine kinase
LQGDRSAPREARAAVAALADIDERTRQDLMIIVSELVANAVRHAPPAPAGEIVLTIVREEAALRVEVRDPGYGFDPTPDPVQEGGLGLAIVERIARDWGIVHGGRTLVWCEIGLTPGP